MGKRYTITLSSSDKLIATWKSKALKANQEKMGTLVKKAILAFIESGEFIDIGHIHFNPDNVTVKKGDFIPLQTARTPIIDRWIEENRAAGLDVSSPIKLLLTKCIKIIPETEDEFFPSPKSSRMYNETNMLHLMKANAAKISEQDNGTSNSIKAKHDIKKNEAPLPESVTVPMPEIKSQDKAIPKSGQVVNGLNSLLPQRASKKM